MVPAYDKQITVLLVIDPYNDFRTLCTDRIDSQARQTSLPPNKDHGMAVKNSSTPQLRPLR